VAELADYGSIIKLEPNVLCGESLQSTQTNPFVSFEFTLPRFNEAV
jgi:hypothetical protein